MGGGPLNGLREPMKCRIPKLPTTAGDTNDGDDYKHRQEKRERDRERETFPKRRPGQRLTREQTQPRREDKRKTTDTHLPQRQGNTYHAIGGTNAGTMNPHEDKTEEEETILRRKATD